MKRIIRIIRRLPLWIFCLAIIGAFAVGDTGFALLLLLLGIAVPLLVKNFLKE
jgi:hypothetical protein